jgi:TatD DNase family protein
LDLLGGEEDENPVADAGSSVARAAAVGIAPLLSVGTDVASSRWQVQAARSHPGVHAAVAIHPNESIGAGEAEWSAIERLAADSAVVAVGETGLDHYRTRAGDWAAQEASFRRHIAIAKAVGKALVIHDREAHADCLRVLAEEGAPERTVFHCFSGDVAMARECARAGYAMSFAGNLTFKNAVNLRQAATAAPAELLLVETDAPFLTPEPHRGRPNAPYLVPYTLRALAELKGLGDAQLAETLAATAARVFGWSPP